MTKAEKHYSKVIKELSKKITPLEQLEIDVKMLSEALKEADIKIKELKKLLDKSHNRGLTSDKHDKEVQEALNKD